MKKILVTGLCTLHWGRLQFGNIGNYYIVEPLFRQLHKHFPEYCILTTFQMDQNFCEREDITIVPMELYYNWSPEEDVERAKKDLECAKRYMEGDEPELTSYVHLVNDCEYIINVSGDMWGDNAEHVGHDRFLVDCLKMKTAQVLNKKTILYAVTPGPFYTSKNIEFVKEVFSGFQLVVIRERVSYTNLQKWGFSVDNVVWAPCPSYLFEKNDKYKSKWTEKIEMSQNKQRKVIGLTFGGFNMPVGPYDMWPRNEEQYDVFISLVEYIVKELDSDIIIFSHTNGFELPPKFKLINGRDFVILNEFYNLVVKRYPNFKKNITIIDEPLLPCDIKTVIGMLDILVTGRVHASVASISQCIPTVFMEYDRNVIYSDKMSGFSEQVKMKDYVCIPGDFHDIKDKLYQCYNSLPEIKNSLVIEMAHIREKATSIFESIRNINE